jgi:hypothetical protein
MARISFLQGSVQWRVTREPSGRLVGVCDPLGVVLEGTDMNDLDACIREAIQLIFTDLLRNGQLETFLLARGWQPSMRIPDPNHEPVHFEPPIQLLIQEAETRDRARVAN